MKLINYLTNLAIENYKDNRTYHHHQAIIVKNGKVIGVGVNSLEDMNLLNIESENMHAEISAFKDYLSKNQKMRLKFNRSKGFISNMFNSCFNGTLKTPDILCKQRIRCIL